MFALLRELIDADSLFELKKLFAPEVITAFARIEGRPVGIVASQPKHKGGVLFVDSADKAARFIWLCDAFGIPILYLADVPGFMIGTKVEREGIIRHGAKMVMAVSEATVPKICVIVRKAYGAGLYAFGGPAFEPDATIALPQAMIAVMGPEAAVNAVYFNKIQEKPESQRAAFVQQLREDRGAGRHPVPYVEDKIEYPVLLGVGMWFPSVLAPDRAGYFALTFVLLAGCALLTLWWMCALPGTQPWIWAASPALLVYGALNWDLFGILPLAGGLFLWAGGRERAAAAALSLAVWTKLFPEIGRAH